ncbi:hypothetical protein EVA_19355 [gut metagenome]|uniref:Uncharacterized protein n=1 Tax=gut metagenome TaxID=749906 RepID=J9FDS0_9ZZZZ
MFIVSWMVVIPILRAVRALSRLLRITLRLLVARLPLSLAVITRWTVTSVGSV